MTTVLDTSQVSALVSLWQRELRLQDWKISVVLRSLDCYGTCSASPDTRTARIDIDLGRNQTQQDLHDTIVHELLHVVFWWAPTGGVSGALLERAFHQVAGALARKHLNSRKPKCGRNAKNPRKRT